MSGGTSGRTTGKRDTDKGAAEREYVTLIDPAGAEFSTGHLATVNSLLMQGYTLKEEEPLGEVQGRLAPQQAQVTADGNAAQ